MPSHVIEGSHAAAGSGALAGEQIYSDTAPPTDLIAVDMNAVWHGLRTLVKQEQISGDLTAGSGATDLSEGFIRLSKAFRRAARRFQSSNIQTVTVNANPLLFSCPPDIMVYSLIDAGSPLAADSKVHPDPNTNAQNKNRLIYITNDTTAVRQVGHSVSGRYVRLGPGEGCLFYGNDDGSGTTYWRPISMQLDALASSYPTISAQWFNELSTSNVSGSVSVSYLFHGPGRRMITLNIPEASITISGSTTNKIMLSSTAGLTDFPSQFRSILDTVSGGPHNSPVFPISLSINGVGEIAACHLITNDLAPNSFGIEVSRAGGLNFNTTNVVVISAMSLTYIGAR